MLAVIDLNADLGEGCGDDTALLEVVTTANVAAGGHAGGGTVLSDTVATAVARGVAVGAHPSYLDRGGFGRTSLAGRMSPAEISEVVADQVVAVGDECARHGSLLSHVKAHGALYHDVMVGGILAQAFLDGISRAGDRLGATSLPVMGLPDSGLAAVAGAAGVPYIAEAFADRAYRGDGTLVPRGEAGAVLEDADGICAQAVLIATRAFVVGAGSVRVPVRAATLCLHGDTPGALAIARAVRQSLEGHGVRIAAPTRPSG
jgi:UPF0271 protein